MDAEIFVLWKAKKNLSLWEFMDALEKTPDFS